MRVLIVPSWYTPGPNKQLGAFFREQALALASDGVDVIVADATLQGRNGVLKSSNFHMEKLNDEGLDTYVRTSPAFGLGSYPNLFVKCFYHNLEKIYGEIVKDGKSVDVLHAHSYYPAGYAAIKLGKKFNIPVVITEHSSSILSNKITTSQGKLLQECVENATSFICVSNALRKAILEYTGTTREILVIPNMVDNRFVPNNAAAQSELFCYVSIGNLIHSKRFDLTIQSFAMCFKGQEQVKLKIIGDGELSTELESLAK